MINNVWMEKGERCLWFKNKTPAVKHKGGSIILQYRDVLLDEGLAHFRKDIAS